MSLRCILFAALLAMAAGPGLVSPALAGPREDVEAGSARCASIANDRAWLDCYYGAAQPMRAQLGLPPAPNSQQALVPPAGPAGYVAPASAAAVAPPVAAAAPPARPGFWARLLTPTEDKPEQPTRMTSYKFDAGGFFLVTLANGETWRQSKGDTILAKWRARPASYTVTIEPTQNLAGMKEMKVGRDQTYLVEQVH